MTALFLILAVLAFADTVEAAAQCPAGWTYSGVSDSCYLVDARNKVTYDQATEKCKSYQATLATPHTREELAFIASNVNFYAWLGLDDIETEGTFLFQDGQELEYNVWYPGGPSGSRGRNCVSFDGYSETLYDESCNANVPYICQVPSTPDPCEEFTCYNNGVCFSTSDGVAACECPTGYAGDQCQELTIKDVIACDAEHPCPKGLDCMEVYLSCPKKGSCKETNIPSSVCLPQPCQDCNKQGVCNNRGMRVHCTN